MFNVTAELADNLSNYTKFTESRSAVNYPAKMDVPMVWDLYMDTEPPLSDGAAPPQADYEPDGIARVTYPAAITGDADLLGLVNDRLKTQARRYPHPITNELEDFH